jgi:hypothetical protein
MTQASKEQTMFKLKLSFAIPILLTVLGFPATSFSQAQVTKEQLQAVREKLHAPQDFYNKLSEEQRKMLSGGALNFFHTIQNWSQLEKVGLAGKRSLGRKDQAACLYLLKLIPSSQPRWAQCEFRIRRLTSTSAPPRDSPRAKPRRLGAETM